MKKSVERVKSQIRHEIDTRELAMKEFEQLPGKLIEEAFPDGHWYYTWLCHFEFILPFSHELIQTVRDFMENQFPDATLRNQVQHIWGGSSGAGFFLTYKIGDIRFDFAFRSTEKGSMCILNKIGTETKIVPIYEVVCSEAAAKEFTS